MAAEISKPFAFGVLMGSGDLVGVHLDARREGVIVPERFKAESNLLLHFGFNLARPIPDMHVDDHGISATLSFDGATAFMVSIPWSAVWFMEGSEMAHLWPESAPPGALKDQTPKEEKKRSAPARKLHLVH